MSKKAVKKVAKNLAKKAVKKVAKKAEKKVAKKAEKKVAKKAVKKVAKKPAKKEEKEEKELAKKKKDYAIFSQDPPGYTNAGIFSFFNKISDLYDILYNMYACYKGFDQSMSDELEDRIDAFLASIKQDDLTNELIERAEAVIDNRCYILYIGKTSDLAFSMDNFSKKVRTRFRKSEEYENPDAIKPIEESELKDFFSYVSEYFHG